MATDPNEVAHYQQQHQELTRQVEVAEEALKGAKSSQGGATHSLEQQLKGLKDELKNVQTHLKDRGIDPDDKRTQRQFQTDQAREQANIQPAVDVEENKRQEEAQRQNLAPKGGAERGGDKSKG